MADMTVMTKNLDTIPYDVFFQIVSSLDCHDFINLSRVNQILNERMRDGSIARKTIENNLLHTKEGQKADQTKSGYWEAVSRLFDIKEAFATAQPYSVSVLAYGTSFLYKDGSLCYIHNNEVRVLDVHGAGQVEQVLNIHYVISRAIPNFDPAHHTAEISLLNYSDGILAFLVECGGELLPRLLVVDLRSTSKWKSHRLRFQTPLQSKERLFVRHNKSFLYYGTHSALGNQGNPQWEVRCVNLATRQHASNRVVLDNFMGNDIGQTVCFEVHQDHLYAVSTQLNYEAEEEVDWTSLYMWICLPPRETSDRVQPSRTWRRQHREGPINDSWLDLSLREDEATNQLLILECRREWRHGNSDNCRIYYKQPLPSPAEISRSKRPEYNPPPSSNASIQLPDDPLTKTLDSTNMPTYERPHKRLRKDYHPEYPLSDDDDDDDDDSSNSMRHDFILAKTKFRAYNLSASTFVDLVNDPHPPPAGSHIPIDRLRLRAVSRKRKNPINESTNTLYKPDTDNDGNPLESSEERFTTRGIHMWPAPDAPANLNRLLCPSRRIGRIDALADERSIIYAIDQEGLQDGTRAIVLMSFDPVIGFPGLRRLVQSGVTPTASALGKRPQVDAQGQEGRSSTRAGNPPVVREEPAMYLSIDRGYWLR